MAGIAANFVTLLGFVSEAWRRRGRFASGADGARALLLRISVTNAGKRVLGGGIRTLRLRGAGEPLFVRRHASDFLLVEDIFFDEEYAPAKRWNLGDRPVVLDLGANVGLATRYLLDRWPAARVVAVEPDAGNGAIYRMNAGAPRLVSGQVRLVQAFVAAQAGQAGIDRGVAEMGFSKTPLAAGGEAIPCVTVPQLMSDAGLAEIDLLKCDVEGAEAEIFADCSAWIGAVHHMVVETHAPYSPAKLYDHLRAAGWSFVVVHEARRGPFADCFLARTSA